MCAFKPMALRWSSSRTTWRFCAATASKPLGKRVFIIGAWSETLRGASTPNLIPFGRSGVCGLRLDALDLLPVAPLICQSVEPLLLAHGRILEVFDRSGHFLHGSDKPLDL